MNLPEVPKGFYWIYDSRWPRTSIAHYQLRQKTWGPFYKNRLKVFVSVARQYPNYIEETVPREVNEVVTMYGNKETV